MSPNDEYELQNLLAIREKVIEAVTQRLDHICWLDVYRDLAALVGVEFNLLLLPRELLKCNCHRFIDSIYDGLPYSPDALTQYVDYLEDVIKFLPCTNCRDWAHRRLAGFETLPNDHTSQPHQTD